MGTNFLFYQRRGGGWGVEESGAPPEPQSMAQAFVPGGLRGGSPLAKVFCDIELLLKHKLQVFVNGGGVHLSKLTFQMFAFKSNSRNLLATQHKETNSVNSQPVWLSIRYRGFCLHVHPQRFLFAAQLQRPVLLTSS